MDFDNSGVIERSELPGGHARAGTWHGTWSRHGTWAGAWARHDRVLVMARARGRGAGWDRGLAVRNASNPQDSATGPAWIRMWAAQAPKLAIVHRGAARAADHEGRVGDARRDAAAGSTPATGPVHRGCARAQARGGRRRACLRMLVARQAPLLIALARRMLRDEAEAEDIVQEALVRLWRSAASLEVRALWAQAMAPAGRLEPVHRPHAQRPAPRCDRQGAGNRGAHVSSTRSRAASCPRASNR